MSNSIETTVVDTTNKDGGKLRLVVRVPGHKILQDAQMVYSVELTALMKKSVADGSQLFSKQQLDTYLNNLGIWTEDDAKAFLRLQFEIRALEYELRKGGLTVSGGKNIAIAIRIKRKIMMGLYGKRSQFDAITMESMADNKKFKFLMARCVTVQIDNKPFFANIDDYDLRQGEQAAVDTATVLAGMLYGYDRQSEANLVENKWLTDFKFADDSGRLIDDKGRLVNEDGSLIDENGRFVDESGNFIDNQGRRVDENGDFVVEADPFIDDTTGEPLVKPQKKRTQKTKKSKKRGKTAVN